MSDTSGEVLERYFEIHGSHLSGHTDRSEWFATYVRKNYLSYLPAQDGLVLEFGCGDGYVLNALKQAGYGNLEGIDVSPEFVAIAQKRTGITKISTANVFDFLPDKTSTYSAIISKAVVEHIEKERLSQLIKLSHQALKPGGVFIVDVPNMDWICASHERYMDITHQNGFTRESLESVLRLAFEQVSILPAERVFPMSVKSYIKTSILKPVVTWAVRQIYNVFGDGEASTWFEHRAIIGIATK